jgi:hypothetical protein
MREPYVRLFDAFEQISEEEAYLDTRKVTEDQSLGSTDAVLPLKDPNPAIIKNDPELEELAAHLKASAPLDLAFRRSLRSRIIAIQREHQASQTSETGADYEVSVVNGSISRELL